MSDELLTQTLPRFAILVPTIMVMVGVLRILLTLVVSITSPDHDGGPADPPKVRYATYPTIGFCVLLLVSALLAGVYLAYSLVTRHGPLEADLPLILILWAVLIFCGFSPRWLIGAFVAWAERHRALHRKKVTK
jgi:hypothetical protein